MQILISFPLHWMIYNTGARIRHREQYSGST
jgi:hypothetical protein